MWVSLEQLGTSNHHLLKTNPLSLLTALCPKGKPMASRMKGSRTSRLLLSREDSRHSSLTAIKDSLTTAIRNLTATITRMATSSLLRAQECDLYRQPSQRTFTDTGRHGKPKRLLSPDGNLAGKRTDF